MLTKTIAAVALLTIAAAPAWAVNKCTGPDGAPVFQDAPCAGRGEKVKVWDSKLTDGGGTVRIGMTEEQVIRAWGKPEKINTTITAGGKTQQWVYGYGAGSRQYLYLENGVLRTIQTPE